MNKKTGLRILLTFLLAFTFVISSVAPASAATYVKLNSSVKKKIKANTSSTNKFHSDWRYWSQGASANADMRKVGCRFVAYSKLLAEVGYDDFGDPDGFRKWATDHKYFNTKFQEIDKTIGKAPCGYVSAMGGGTLKLEGVVKLAQNNKQDAETIMKYINQGYYVVACSARHFAYVGHQASLDAGKAVLLDSFSGSTVNPAQIVTYATNPNNTYTKFRYYSFTPSGGSSSNNSSSNNNSSSSGNSESSTSGSTSSRKWVTGAAGTYHLVPKCAPTLSLNVHTNHAISGRNVTISKSKYTSAQNFTLNDMGNGYYKITTDAGMALDVYGAGTAAGTNVQQYRDNGTDAQLWRIEEAGDGYYYIVPKVNESLVLDVNGADSADGTNVQVWGKNGSSAQMWKFYTVPVRLTYNGERTSIGSTNATISNRITFYNTPVSSCTEVGMYLYDSDYNVIGYAQEGAPSTSKNYFDIWYDINSELGVSLEPGTTYVAQFYAIVDGATCIGHNYVFTTGN